MRLSVFPLDGTAALGTSHWEKGAGKQPETVKRPPQQQRVIEEGPWGEAWLQVDSLRGQIHWLVSADMNPDAPGSIGAFPDAIPPFHGLMCDWLKAHCPPVNRIAFAVNLMFPTGSPRETCAHLNDMLPAVEVAADDTRDFMYQINRRRRSRCLEGLEINRLAKWSSAEGRSLEVTIAAGVPSARAAKVRYFRRLEPDINTVPTPDREIPRHAFLGVFDELVSAAKEIAVKGDVP